MAAGAPALRWEAAATVDTLHVGTPSFTSVLGHVDVRANGDAGRLFGWPATSFRVEALADYGGKPNGRAQTLQGLSNIEVKRNATRLYAAWLQHDFSAQVDALAGLYDLNSEFYSTEAASLLIHPAFGIGSELSQTGRNGPSIFPNLGAAVRVRARAPDGHYAQAALIAATAGDPAHPGRTVVRISRREGALVVAEAGWQQAADSERGAGHWGIGAWSYTEPVPRLDGIGRGRNTGVYALGQSLLHDFGGERIVGFARAGIAAASVNAIDCALDAGVLVQRAHPDAGPRAWVVGLALARLGRGDIDAQARGGASLSRTEATLEVGARWRLGASLTVQPLLQHVTHAGGRPGSATVVGARWVWTLAGGD